MKLKEKFEEIFIENFSNDWENECEKTAEEFAIGFAEWVWLNAKEYMRGGYYSLQPFVENVDLSITYTISELLEIYKKEKGL